MIAGTLEIQMLTNLARLADDMSKAKSMVSGAMGDIEKTVGMAKKALGALGIGLSVGFFVNLIKGSIDAMDHLQDLSKVTNIAVEDLAGLRIAAKQSGSDLEGTAASINKLAQNMGKDEAKFRALGVTAKEPLEAFKQLADVYVALEDPQQRAAVMAEALGKSWAGAAPLLAEGSKKIGEMVDVGKKASGVTAEMAKLADELNDKWVLLGGTGGFLVRMIGPLLPLMNVLADNMLKAQQNASGLNDEFSPMLEAFKTVAVLGANVAFVFRMIGGEIGSTMAKWAALARLDFKGANLIAKEWVADRKKARADLDQFEKEVMGGGRRGATGGKPDGADEAAIRSIIDAENAAKKARRFLAGQKDGPDNEAIAEIIAQAKAEEAQTQQVKEIARSVEAANQQRELDQIAITNAQKIKYAEEVERDLLLLQQEAMDERDRITRESTLGRIEFEKQQSAAQLAGAQSFLGNMASLMNTHSRKAFEVGKIAAISQAAVSGALAVMDAWKSGMSTGGPWAPLVATAYAAAAGINALNLINNIRKQQFGGGGAGGGSVGGTPVSPGQGASGFTSAEQQASQEKQGSSITLNLTVNGHILDTQDFTDTIMIPALRDAIDNRDVTIIGANSRQASDLVPA